MDLVSVSLLFECVHVCMKSELDIQNYHYFSIKEYNLLNICHMNE